MEKQFHIFLADQRANPNLGCFEHSTTIFNQVSVNLYSFTADINPTFWLCDEILKTLKAGYYERLLVQLSTAWPEGAVGWAGTNTANKGTSPPHCQVCRDVRGAGFGIPAAWTPTNEGSLTTALLPHQLTHLCLGSRKVSLSPQVNTESWNC